MSIRQTPLIRCEALERGVGEVYLKLECLQRTGSFKLRGASLAIAALGDEARERGVVTASAGNHGAGLSLAGRGAGIPVTVVVPTRTPANKQERMRNLGAELIVRGDGYDDSERIARSLAAERGATFVSAFDDDNVLRGNGGTLGAEVVAQLAERGRTLGTILVPVGGGGLIAGMANELSPRGVTVIGCQPENNCAMRDSMQLGRALCEYEKLETVAEGCEGAVCERTFAIVQKHGLHIETVSEASIVAAVRFLFEACGVVAEASAAVPVAVLQEHALPPQSEATVVVISGGNIDAETLDAMLAQGAHETQSGPS